MSRKAIGGHRRHVVVPDAQYQAFERISRRTGLTISELMRQAFTFYLAHVAEKLHKK